VTLAVDTTTFQFPSAVNTHNVFPCWQGVPTRFERACGEALGAAVIQAAIMRRILMKLSNLARVKIAG
jgi:hypothetical protein